MNEKIPPSEQLQKTLTRIKSLTRREIRDRQQSLWIEGIRHFIQAFDAHWQFDSILYSRILCPTSIRLPMPGRADSLNVAVATAVVMYELIRRQTEPAV